MIEIGSPVLYLGTGPSARNRAHREGCHHNKDQNAVEDIHLGLWQGIARAPNHRREEHRRDGGRQAHPAGHEGSGLADV